MKKKNKIASLPSRFFKDVSKRTMTVSPIEENNTESLKFYYNYASSSHNDVVNGENETAERTKQEMFFDDPKLLLHKEFPNVHCENESKYKYKLVTSKSIVNVKLISAVEILRFVPKTYYNKEFDDVKNILTQAILLDEIDESTFVYIPGSTDRSYNGAASWYDEMIQSRILVDSIRCFVSKEDIELIHIHELIYHSERKVLSNPDFHTLSGMFKNHETLTIACRIINQANISKSVILILLLINHLDQKDYAKVKASIKLIPQYFDIHGRSVDQIVYTATNLLSRELKNEELEMIADLYASDLMQKSNMFEFKLKIKKK